MFKSYPKVNFDQLSSVPDGEFISITGHYFRQINAAYLRHRQHTLRLLGEPFSWVPPQGTQVQIAGELVKGNRPRLLIHDIYAIGADIPEAVTHSQFREGDEALLTAHVKNIGDTQLAITSCGVSYILIGTELDERKYLVQGQIVTLNPPTLSVDVAVPLLGVHSASSLPTA